MGLTRPRAYQIFDIDYKQSVRVVTVSNVTLSGGAPSQVDGVTLSLNDRVLVTGQSTGSQNGLYYVTTVGTGSNGTWARSVDGNETGEIDAGMIVMVTEGTTYADTQWKLTTNDPIVIGSTALTFVLNVQANSISSGTSNVVVNANSNVTVSVAGTANVLTVTSTGANIAGNLATTGRYLAGNGTVTQPSYGFLGDTDSGVFLTGDGNVGITTNAGLRLLVNDGGANVTGAINVTSAASVAGNISGGNILTVGQVSSTGTITTAAGTNSTGFAVGNGAVSNVGLGFFPTAGTRGDYAIRDYSSVFSTMYLDVGIGGSAGGEFQFRTGNTYSLSMRANSSGVYSSGVMSATGIVYGSELNSTNSQANEGGQINLALPSSGSTLSTSVIVDVYQNRLRFFEGGGTARGAYIDLTSCSASAGTNLLAGGGGGTPGGSNTYVQFNDAGTFGGNGQFTFDKVTNIVTAGAFAGNTNGTGQNFKVGDDAWIGDINVADTIGLKGQQNAANCYIVFGNSDATGRLGRAGTGPLTYAGAFSATGNVTGGNILTGGLISATGTITGSTFSGAGTNLTGTASSLTVGTATVAGTVTTAAQPNITSVGTLSSLTVTANVAGGNLTTAGQVVATANVTGGNLRTAGQVSATGNITGGGLVGTLYTNSIVNTGANATGNIGSSTLYFNTAFVKATSAQYADLAEMYVADANYNPGTVVEFGGNFEITQTTVSCSTAVAGIISTDPSYLMNSAQPGEFVLPVALTGRVPCRVLGPVKKGDVLISSNIPGVAQRIGANWQPGCTVGKAMETIIDHSVQTIEVAVGRL